MFFNNKVDTSKTEELNAKIASLESELSLYKESFDYSQEEILVVVDKNNQIILKNTLANSLIKDSTTLVKELLAKGVEKENIRIDRNVDITDMAEKAIQAIKDSLDNKTIG